MKIKAENSIQEKEKEFTKIQNETMIRKVSELPTYIQSNQDNKEFLKEEIKSQSCENVEKIKILMLKKFELYTLMLKSQHCEELNRSENIKDRELKEMREI